MKRWGHCTVFCPACLLFWVTELPENVQNLARTVDITETLILFVCLSYNLSVKFFPIVCNLKKYYERELEHFLSVSLWSVAPNAEFHNFYYPVFFRLLKISFLLHIMSNKGVSQCSFYCNRTAKGQFQLQMLILRKGTGASFESNTFLYYHD